MSRVNPDHFTGGELLMVVNFRYHYMQTGLKYWKDVRHLIGKSEKDKMDQSM